jgi:hypothetical protein
MTSPLNIAVPDLRHIQGAVSFFGIFLLLFQWYLPDFLNDGGVSEWPMVTVLKSVEKPSP